MKSQTYREVGRNATDLTPSFLLGKTAGPLILYVTWGLHHDIYLQLVENICSF